MSAQLFEESLKCPSICTTVSIIFLFIILYGHNIEQNKAFDFWLTPTEPGK